MKLTEAEEEKINKIFEFHPDLDEIDSLDLEEIFRDLRLIASKISNENSGENNVGRMHQGMMVLLGIVKRTHDLIYGNLTMVNEGNRHVSSSIQRSLIETLGLLAWIEDENDRIISVLSDESPPSTGKIMNLIKKESSAIENDYDELSNTVHPLRNSIVSMMRVMDEEERKSFIAMPSPKLKDEEVQTRLGGSIVIVRMIIERLENLLEENPEILEKGKLVGKFGPVNEI